MGFFREIMIQCLAWYHRWISPLLGPRCRFQPSCSQYMSIAIARFGLLKGGWIGLKRLLRCHPGSDGGEDPVPMTVGKKYD